MLRKMKSACFITAICLGFIASKADMIQAASFKILVVMSYEAENPWCIQIKEGIGSVLAGSGDIKYFYMETKKNLRGAAQKAKEAHELYERFRPDGVIAADDNAQSMFVLPYLKDRVKTPVMFCGVNESPLKYGYPASNVSGILEHNFVRESIAFAKQLVPSIKTVGFLAKDSPSGQAILKQVESESETYKAKYVGFKLVKTIKGLLAVLEEFNKTSDLLYVEATNGILDEKDVPLNNQQVTDIIAKSYNKPIIGSNTFHVKYGALCAVVKSGNAQGRISAEMLLKALKGTPMDKLPITVNKYGKRMLNVTVMKKFGIRPKRRVLVGTELVKTANGGDE